jgi:hypothetical protein
MENLPAGQAGKTGKPAFAAGRYFKYAIGEIILVVIGILIALQINNWNEEQKRANQEQIILLSLRSDFTESKLRLKETMIQQKNCVARSIALISIYEGNLPMPINDSIKIYLEAGAFSWFRSELVTSAYDALINTGNSDLIKNETLNKSLAEYFSILNAGFEDHETSMFLQNKLMTIAETALLPLSDQGYRDPMGLPKTSNVSKENEAINYLFKQDAFFGHLYVKTQIEGFRYNLQKDLMNRIIELIAIIDKELKPIEK